MSESTIYWITRLDGINTALAIVIGVLIVSFVITVLLVGIAIITEQKYNGAKLNRMLNKILLGLVIASLVAVFVPSTKEMVAIKVIPALANSRLADKSLQNIDALLDVCVEQLKARKKD